MKLENDKLIKIFNIIQSICIFEAKQPQRHDKTVELPK